MTAIWFVIPAKGRFEKTNACLRQLARTCDTLEEWGVYANAVVMADDENLDSAVEHGFVPLCVRDSEPLGLKWNSGYRFAGGADADYVVPLGSDDWIDPIMLTELPDDHQIRCTQETSVVREDGRCLATLKIWYPGGDGVRILPAALLARLGWRPADETRNRAIDTSILNHLTRALGCQPEFKYFDPSPYCIVDWKTAGDQLNTYAMCLAFNSGPELDPWEVLKDRFPAVALDEMRQVYGLVAA